MKDSFPAQSNLEACVLKLQNMLIILQKDNTVALKSHIVVCSAQHGLGQLNLVKVSFIWEVQEAALFLFLIDFF